MIFITFISVLLIIGFIRTPTFKIQSAEIAVPSLTGDEQNHAIDAGFFICMKKIVIYSKKYGKKTVLIDEEDYERVKRITWTLQYSNKGKGRFIVCGWVNGRTEKLHRFILRVPYKSKIRTIHLNGDNFNNQKNNLKAIIKCEFKMLSNKVVMTLRSHAFGEKQVYFEKKFYKKFKHRTWRIVKGIKTFYCATIGANNQVLFMHRIIKGCPKKEIDHIDCNGLNNLASNLRLATRGQNSYNTTKRSHNTSGFKGVSWSKHAKMYYVTLKANKKLYTAGYFHSLTNAAKAYNDLARRHHKKFANYNLV